MPAAEQLAKDVPRLRRQTRGDEHPETAKDMCNRTAVLLAGGKQAEAMELAKDVLERRVRALGLLHPAILTGMNNIAWTLHAKGGQKAAAALWGKALPAAREVWGDDHARTIAIRDVPKSIAVTPSASQPDNPVPEP
jgi:hypothetical protein